MKTAEEWQLEMSGETSVEIIRMIQLDAMRHAAKIAHNISRGTYSEDRAIAIDEVRDAIIQESYIITSTP